jgi:hypothetical protein
MVAELERTASQTFFEHFVQYMMPFSDNGKDELETIDSIQSLHLKDKAQHKELSARLTTLHAELTRLAPIKELSATYEFVRFTQD